MAKKGTASRPLPPFIFGQPSAKWTIPLLRHFLALFKKKLVPRQHRTTMLVRLTDLEGQTPLLKQYTIAQIQRRGAPLTRKAIDSWTKEGSSFPFQPFRDFRDRNRTAYLLHQNLKRSHQTETSPIILARLVSTTYLLRILDA